MSSMNPYQGYEYAMFQMNGLNSSYPIKMEDSFTDPDIDRDETSGQTPLPYMGTFGKHPAHMAMFYSPQLPYDHLHPLIMNQRRRSSDSMEPLEVPPHSVSPPFVNYQTNKEISRDSARYRPARPRVQPKRDSEEDLYMVPEHQVTADESSEFPTKTRKSYFCRSCGKTFKFQTSLLRHNNKVHLSKYQCPTCSRVFSRQAYLDVHTSKQGSSCFLDPSARTARSRPAILGQDRNLPMPITMTENSVAIYT